MLVAFEGIDGAGKSTQIRLISGYLALAGVLVRTIDRTTPLRRVYKSLIQEERTFPDPLTSLYLGAAGVAELLNYTPASNNEILVFHRHIASPLSDAIAYEVDENVVASIWASFKQPDLTILIDTPPEIAVSRKRHISLAEAGGPRWLEPQAGSRVNAYLAYQTEARRAYLRLAAWDVERWWVVDGTYAPEILARQLSNRLLAAFRGTREP